MPGWRSARLIAHYVCVGRLPRRLRVQLDRMHGGTAVYELHSGRRANGSHTGRAKTLRVNVGQFSAPQICRL